MDGTVSSCGRNDEGQLGDGTFIDSDKTSVIIPDDEKIVAIGSGASSQSAFFIGEENVYGTGANDRNQLGLGESGKTEVPTLIVFGDSDVDIVGISSSGTHTVACNLNVDTEAPTYSPSTLDPTPEPTAAPTISEFFIALHCLRILFRITHFHDKLFVKLAIGSFGGRMKVEVRLE